MRKYEITLEDGSKMELTIAQVMEIHRENSIREALNILECAEECLNKNIEDFTDDELLYISEAYWDVVDFNTGEDAYWVLDNLGYIETSN